MAGAIVATWRIDFYHDWAAGFLWPAGPETWEAFGIPIVAEDLPVRAETVAELYRLAEWHDTALNWDSPADPGPFREEECARLNAAVRALIATLREELGPEWEVIDSYRDLHEDPDLDAYLRDPQGFRRR